MTTMGPRLFGIAATEAPVIAVLRRGPSGWCHVGRWDPEAASYEPGSWIRGAIYPQRCDVSPDGRWLVYFVLKASASWPQGATYVGVSRLPWLTALAAWGTDGTWTRGLGFVQRGSAAFPPPPPEVGDLAPLLAKFDLDQRRPASFAIERARGWTETPDSPPRTDDDVWDEKRAARLAMEKPRPADAQTRLVVRGWYAAHRGGSPSRGPARYALERGGEEHRLAGVQWAEWGRDGRLLVATERGELQVRPDPWSDEAAWRSDLGALEPAPAPPPAEATRW